MVRAVLDDSKTQTRRTAKLTDAGHVKEPGGHRRWHPGDPNARLACPYGQPGDRLWVREAWRAVDLVDDCAPRELTAGCRVWYEADAPHQPGYGRYRPPMFMPRWASRITLEITAVRIERLQDISEADAIAEGAPWAACGSPQEGSHKAGYAALWESINGTGSWAANPLVWVVEFKRVKP